MAPHVKQSFRDYEETKQALALTTRYFPFSFCLLKIWVHWSKGQLISELLFGVQKITQKFDKFLPNNLKFGQINKIKALFYNIIDYM